MSQERTFRCGRFPVAPKTDVANESKTPRSSLIHLNLMMCSGPFFGAQGHSILQTRRERRSHMDWKRGEVASEANCFRLTFPE